MAVTRKELLGGGTIAGAVALGVAPVAQAHGGAGDIVGSSNIRDNTGAVVFTARGTISGERIEV